MNCTLLPGATGCGVKVINSNTEDVVILSSNGTTTAIGRYNITESGTYTVIVYVLNSTGIDISVEIDRYQFVFNIKNSTDHNNSSNNCKYIR